MTAISIRRRVTILPIKPLAIIGASLVLALLYHGGGDFAIFYRAAQHIIAGQSPYTVAGFYSPLVVALAFTPLSILPESFALYLFTFGMAALWIVVLLRITSHFAPLITTLVMASPLMAIELMSGNMNALPLAALFVPAPLAVWLAVMKPNVGAILFAFIVWREWRSEGIKRAAWLALPVVGMLVVSALLGMQPTNVFAHPANKSLWPLAIPIGLWLIGRALMKRDESSALAAGPCLTPYLTAQSWLAVLPVVVKSKVLTVAFITAIYVLPVLWWNHL